MFRFIAEKKLHAQARAQSIAGKLMQYFPDRFRQWGSKYIARMLWGAYKLAENVRTTLGNADAGLRSEIMAFLDGRRHKMHDPYYTSPLKRLSPKVREALIAFGKKAFREGYTTDIDMRNLLARNFGVEVLPHAKAVYTAVTNQLGVEPIYEHHFEILPETWWGKMQRLWLHAEGLMGTVRRGRKHRRKRPQRTHIGSMMQLDGSDHAWFENRGPRYTLLVFIDDASNTVFLRFDVSENLNDVLIATRNTMPCLAFPRCFIPVADSLSITQ